MRYLFPLTAVLVLTLGCSDDGHPSGDPDPHIVPKPGAEWCGPACQKMLDMPMDADAGPDAALGCEEAQPIELKDDAGTMSCQDLCEYDYSQGVSWGAQCIVEQVDYCVDIEPTCSGTP